MRPPQQIALPRTLAVFHLNPNQKFGSLEEQTLSFARAFIEPRRLLLIDEPTKGLAPAIIGALVECLKEVKRRGAT